MILRTGPGSSSAGQIPAFWISFPLHVVAGELWLRAFPNPPELARESPAASSWQSVTAVPAHPDLRETASDDDERHVESLFVGSHCRLSEVGPPENRPSGAFGPLLDVGVAVLGGLPTGRWIKSGDKEPGYKFCEMARSSARRTRVF